MCKEARGSDVVPQKFAVGNIYTDGTYILLSEGKSTNGSEFCLWARSNRSPLYSIEEITEKETGEGRKYRYARKYSCDILECASNTYLKLLNPSSLYTL